MTGWHIRPGYSSIYRYDDVLAALDAEVETTRTDVKGLRREVIEVESGCGTAEEIVAVVERYAARDDLTLTRHEQRDIANVLAVEWMVLASGGDPWRTTKEAVARAFVRCVVRRMHARGMDVTVVVA